MNQKNHYTSTYQKDYTWPYVSSICHIQPPTKSIIIKRCICIPDSQRVCREEWDGDFDKYRSWSRIGPMGRLLEPKIYPKIKRIPEADVTRFDQLPSICLKEGEEYPSLYDALEKPFLNEIITRVEANRMKTTYQADYSDPAAARMKQRDMTVIDTNDRHLQCSMPIRITIEADCPSYCHLPATYVCSESTSFWKRDHKRKNGSKREKKCGDIERRQIILPSWKSEYQDSISKIGHAIMRAKLHRATRKTLPVQYQYCTASS